MKTLAGVGQMAQPQVFFEGVAYIYIYTYAHALVFLYLFAWTLDVPSCCWVLPLTYPGRGRRYSEVVKLQHCLVALSTFYQND